MDTSDTGDTGKEEEEDTEFQHYWNDGHNHVSASELAGETGGISCSQIGVKPVVGLFVVAFLVLCVRHFDKRNII